jgi:Tfp pilus assembly protein PilO
MLGRSNYSNPFAPVEGATRGNSVLDRLAQIGKNGSSPQRARFVIKPTKKSCIVLASLTGVILAASIGVYFWQSSEIDALSAQVHAKEEQLSSSEKIARDLHTVSDENAETRNMLRYLETSVTQGEYVPTLLHQTQDLAQSTSLHVGRLHPQLEPAPAPPTDKDALKKFVPQPYDKLHVDMDLTGHYWDLAQMLYKLTQFPKIMTVDGVEISPANAQGTTGGDRAQLNVKLHLTGFIFKSDGPPADGTAPAAPRTGATPGTAAPATPKVVSASETTITPIAPKA